MGYTQLTQEQRYQIWALRKAGQMQVEIAREIGVHKSTISRELARNTDLRSYRPKQAHRFAMNAGERKQSHASPTRSGSGLRCCYARVGLRIRLAVGWSWKAGARSATKRPAIVDEKSRIGDWEGDTIIGKSHKGAVVSLVERKSFFTLLGKAERKTAKLVADAEIRLLKPIRDRVHTITKDNGLEFCDHARVGKAIKADIYFARPYASNQRGLNENINGLVRQYLPKTRRLDTVTEEELDLIMLRLNHRPRKTLGYRTPYEVFFNTQTQLTGVALGN